MNIVAFEGMNLDIELTIAFFENCILFKYNVIKYSYQLIKYLEKKMMLDNNRGINRIIAYRGKRFKFTQDFGDDLKNNLWS